MIFLHVSLVSSGGMFGVLGHGNTPCCFPPPHASQFELEQRVLCWREPSTAATIDWADSTPPSANRSPSGLSSKLPHAAGSFRRQRSGWLPVRGVSREAESRGWGGQERRLQMYSPLCLGKKPRYQLVSAFHATPTSPPDPAPNTDLRTGLSTVIGEAGGHGSAQTPR